MAPLRIFISSVQSEFEAERTELAAYLRADPLLRRFFAPFLFEEVPAEDRRADDLYLDEVDRCDVYVGILGDEYGSEDGNGLSPTLREFERATLRHKHRLIFIRGADDRQKHAKMRDLIRKADREPVRRRFTASAELIAGVYASLVHFLASRALIREGPFDAAPCQGATLADLNEERMGQFIRSARRERAFPLREEATPTELLIHLNLLDAGRPTHAAVLLFGKQPQRFLLSSEIKCAHFHSTEVTKPIPSYQVYKGSVFELVDHAVDFILSKINLAVGTRALSTQVPVAYEMPPEVVREAVVNAVVHRDYASNGSVQVMLFSDRLEVWNPGTLPPSLTLEKLRHPHGSVPGNPLLAEALYLAKYIERMGTGTGDMIERCRVAGLEEPEFRLPDGFVVTIRRKPNQGFVNVGGQVFELKEEIPTGEAAGVVTGEVAGEVERVIMILQRPMRRTAIQAALGLRHEDHFRDAYLIPAMEAGVIEMTIPDKPKSSRQQYRLTAKGRAWQERQQKRNR